MDRHQRMQIYYELSDWFGQSIRQSGGVGRKARRCEFLAVARARAMHFFRTTMQAEVGENPGTTHTLDGSATVCNSYWTNNL